MKIAHIADSHWGLGYPGPTPRSRFDDICRVMDSAADRMIEKKVDVCLFAGDAFKDAKVMLDRAQEEIVAFHNWILKLANAGIRVIVISGTPSHDAIAAYELINRMVDGDTRIEIHTKPCFTHFNGINFICVPGFNRSGIMTREEYQNKTPQEIHGIMTDKITDITQGALQATEQGHANILLSHLTYSEANTGFEQLLMEHEPLLTPAAVKGYDLVCLGHIHKAQQIQGKPVFYSGSPERLSFGEEDETPGFWIHDVGAKGSPVESCFVLTLARDYITIEAESEEIPVDQTLVQDAVIRVRINATDKDAKLIDRKAIEKKLYESGAFFVQEIRIDAERTDRARDEEVTESLSPIAAVAKWCEQQELSEEETQAMIDMASMLIEEMTV